MLRWLATNLRIFLLALVLALAVWVTAVIAADPDTTQLYPYPIPIEFIGQDSGLVITGTVSKQVQVTLRAPRSIWSDLNANRNSVRATADLTGLGTGIHLVEVQVQILTRPVRIVSVTPQIIELSLEEQVTKTLPIELTLTGEPAIGYKVGETSVEPAEGIISGPESLIAQAKHIRAILDLNNSRQSIVTSLPIVITDENGEVINGITIHPDIAQARVELVQQGGYRDLAVKVMWSGQQASGYKMVDVVPTPPIVTVYSDNIPLLESLPGYVETAPLNISGAASNIEAQLTLNLPQGVLLIGNQTVSVRIEIVAIEGSIKLANRPVEVIGLDPGLKAQVSPTLVDILLSGPLPVLDALLVDDVHIRIDITGLAPGTYQLVPTIIVTNEEVVVQSILPGTVEVVIASAVTPTPY